MKVAVTPVGAPVNVPAEVDVCANEKLSPHAEPSPPTSSTSSDKKDFQSVKCFIVLSNLLVSIYSLFIQSICSIAIRALHGSLPSPTRSPYYIVIVYMREAWTVCPHPYSAALVNL